MENLQSGDLNIEVLEDPPPSPIRFIWTGKSNDRHPAKVLGPYFTAALSTAAERRTPLELHFEKLVHFNSSTITAIIQLIQEARNRGVKVIVVFDQALKWQKLSFDALRVFAKGDELLQLRST